MAYNIDKYGVLEITVDTEQEREHLNPNIMKMSSKVYVIESKKWYILDGNKEWAPYVPEECSLTAMLEATSDLTAEEQEQFRWNLGAASLDDVVSIFTFKGSVADEAHLPDALNEIGDVYLVEDTSIEYIWTVSETQPNGYWEKLGDRGNGIKNAFIVEFSESNGGWIADKTIQETYNAYDNGELVIFKYQDNIAEAIYVYNSSVDIYFVANMTIIDNGIKQGAFYLIDGSGVLVNLKTIVPTGGTSGQALKKSNNNDYETAWVTTNEIPSGGTSNQVLAKSSNTDYATSWQTIYQIPSGGTTGQALLKSSDNNYETTWGNVSAIDSNAVHYTVDSNKTDAEKLQARTNINAAEKNTTISDLSSTSITLTSAANNTIYEYGELTSLTITAIEANSEFIVIFTSGSTATTTNFPISMIFQEAFSAEVNTRYEINVRNGYALVAGWTVSAS